MQRLHELIAQQSEEEVVTTLVHAGDRCIVFTCHLSELAQPYAICKHGHERSCLPTRSLNGYWWSNGSRQRLQ